MNSTVQYSLTEQVIDKSSENALTVMGALQIIMLLGFWVLKLKKRMQSNEAKVLNLEHKISRLLKTSDS